MTREEAIRIAQGLITDFKCESETMVEFCNVVIKALEQEPTTKNDCETCMHNKGVLECDMYGCKYEPTTKNDLGIDCIDRQAVIDMTGLSEWFDSSDSYNEFVFALSELPTVTPLPKQFDLEGLKKDMKALNCGYPYGLDYLLDCLKKRLGITIADIDKDE